ncbi:MAG: hypothetical protein ACRDAX_08670 [Propionibacteriaceae bacterium]
MAAATLIIAMSGCSNADSAKETTATNASLPPIVASSGVLTYPMTGADCETGNAFNIGDVVTLLAPDGSTADTGKLIDAFESSTKGKCQSNFALNAKDPVTGEYTIKIGDKTMKATAQQLMDGINWTI